MGKYINYFKDGTPLPIKGKAQALINFARATPVKGDSFCADLVCVVDSGGWDAAGYAFDEEEFEHFRRPDSTQPNRERTWLIVPDADVLSGFKK